jgi:phosphate uptake regulator
MKRKVVKQGHNALTVTMPASWIKENGIRGGDEIDVETRGKELIIKKNGSLGAEKINFKMYGDIKYLPRHLSVLYRLGYDEIKVEFDNPAIVDRIQEEIEEMLGLEIVDQGENYCIIKNIASGLDNEFEDILRKIFLNILHCGEQSLILIKRGDFKSLESLKQLSKVNNRLSNFCERLLNKEGYKDYKKTILVYVMVWNLEQVEDYYSNIFQYLINQNKKISVSKEIIRMYEDVNKLIDMYYNLFYSFDMKNISSLKENCLNVINKTKELAENRNKTDSIMIINLNLIAERVYHMTECLI